MGIKASDQMSIVDLTDGYSVILTSDTHTFPGSTSAAKAGSTTTQIIAMCGASQVAASALASEITAPTGVTVSVDTDVTAPTLTISVTTAVKAGGTITIPVHIGDITIVKTFTFAIAFTGATGATGAAGAAGRGVSGITNYYLASASSSGVTTSTSGWTTTIQTISTSKKYLWNYEAVAYTDGTTENTTPCIIGVYGNTGATGAAGATGVGISSITEYYVVSSSGTTAPTTGWATTVPTMTTTNKYLWNYEVVTYTNGTTENTEKRVIGVYGNTGATGAAGADAITMSLTSSNGTIFKNSAISTVLTAHVFKAGVELTETEIAALGTVKWYKDGAETAVATGITLTIDAGDVTNKATFVAQLEG